MGAIAIDLGGTKLAGAIFSAQGKKLQETNVALEGRRGEAVGALVSRQVSFLMRAANAQRVKVSAVGVSVPGISYGKSGTVWAPNVPGWKAYPLRRELRAAIGRRDVPLVIENDRTCSILGETWKGAAKGCRNAVFVAVGTGIGAGILVDGRVVRGAQDIAGSIGWMALDRPFRAEYVGCGCFEHHASGEGLAKVARQMLEANRGPARRHRRPEGAWTAHQVFAAFDRGDRVASEVLTQALEFWGMAVANLVSLLNPEKIIFGGGVFGPAARFLDEIYAEAKKWAQPVGITQVRLHVSKLGADAALYGAGYLALEASGRKR